MMQGARGILHFENANPISPKTNKTQTLNTVCVAEKAPTAQITITTGSRMYRGVASNFVNSRIPKNSMSSIRMLATIIAAKIT